jgi:hypothetical protein
MKSEFVCPENQTVLIVNNRGDDLKTISVLTPWEGRGRWEYVVCLEGEELERFKEAVAKL